MIDSQEIINTSGTESESDDETYNETYNEQNNNSLIDEDDRNTETEDLSNSFAPTEIIHSNAVIHFHETSTAPSEDLCNSFSSPVFFL